MAERAQPWLLAAALAALTGCSEGRPLLLDQVCRGVSFTGTGTPNCRLDGDARFASGVTADSQGVQLGSAGGSLSIALAALGAPTQSTWSLDVLAASTRPEGSTLYRSLTWGSCGAQCPPDPGDVEAALTEDVRWAKVVIDEPGAQQVRGFAPDDAVITLRGTDIDILDIRTPGFDGSFVPF